MTDILASRKDAKEVTFYLDWNSTLVHIKPRLGQLLALNLRPQWFIFTSEKKKYILAKVAYSRSECSY